MLIFYLCVMLRYSWPLTLLSVCTIALNLFVTRQVSAQAGKSDARDQPRREQADGGERDGH